MQITELRVRNFRCLAEVQVQPGPGLNLIVGDNASGKSSLLEAIYFLGRAQSFRNTPGDRLIRSGEEGLSVFGRLQNGAGPETTLGVQRVGRQRQIKVGASDNASILDLVAALPIQVIDPGLQQLLEEGPEQRRRFLDWGVFHVEQQFYPAWLRYQKALRQRNRALRDQAGNKQISAWDAELVQQGEILDAARRDYVGTLSGALSVILPQLFDEPAVSIEYLPGWPADMSLAESLASGMETDRESGYTRSGAHRADLRIRLQGQQARRRASRGEQKLIAAGLLLAQAELLRRAQDRQPILLIDDLAAELDTHSRARLFSAIRSLGTQAFLSFLEAGQIPAGQGDFTMFHVEHGRVETG